MKLREPKTLGHPQKREAAGQQLYYATDEELANPEWVSKFQLNNPGVKLVQNKPIMIGKPNA